MIMFSNESHMVKIHNRVKAQFKTLKVEIIFNFSILSKSDFYYTSKTVKSLLLSHKP